MLSLFWVHMRVILSLLLSFSVGIGLLPISQAVETKSENGMGFAIMGTIVQAEKGRNVVLLKIKSSSKIEALRIGNKIMGKFEIVQIETHGLLLKEGSKQFFVLRDKFADPNASHAPTTVAASSGGGGSGLWHQETFSEPGFERKKGDVLMSTDYRDRVVNQDLGKILMDATAEPYLENGQIAGFRLYQITEGSIYEKGGFQNDDIITSINGTPLRNVAAAIALLKSLKGENNIGVTIQRGGANVELNLKIQ
jgi:type II secretion system protein C